MDHINSADVANNLGIVCCKKGNYVDAVSYYNHALQIYDREWEEGSIRSAETIVKLGHALRGNRLVGFNSHYLRYGYEIIGKALNFISNERKKEWN